MAATSRWHEGVFFGIHYDLHANEQDTALGATLTLENLREELGKVRPDWIQIDCKGHPGWTSWPTRVGSTSPGVVRDSVALHTEVCRELGIRLGMHYSGVWDTRALSQHPEWGVVNAVGERSQQMTCRLSAYRDELMIPQLLELIDTYGVDGFWVDGENWASHPCWCERCTAEFARRTGLAAPPRQAGEPEWERWLAFHRDLFLEHVTAYTDAVHAREPDCAVCSNWMYTLRQPEPVAAPVDYISGDYMPNFGVYRAALEARFMAHRGLSWDLMCWGFTKDAGHHQLSVWKPAVHLCQEVTEVLAQGGAVMIYGKPQREGRLISWHHDILAEVAAFCRARQPWSFGTVTASQAVVLHLASHYYQHNQPLFNYGRAVEPLEGALHALLETHRSTDILAEEAWLARQEAYDLVVVAEQTHLSEPLVAALEARAAAGATVLLSGAHLAGDWPALVGCRDTGTTFSAESSADAWGAVWLRQGREAIGVQAPWALVEPVDAEVLAEGWGNSDPEVEAAAIPAITRRHVGAGQIVAIHGPIFRELYQTHCPRLRRFLGELLAGCPIDWEVTIAGPPQLELVVRWQGDALLCHLLNRGVGEMTYPQRVIVESVPPLRDITLTVRRAADPTAVVQQPANRRLTWRRDGDRVRIAVPEVGIHDIIVIE